MPSSTTSSGSSSEERPTIGTEVVRDLGGALLFGVPLVYTMEVWWIGQTTQTAVIGGMVVVGAVVAGLLRFAVIPGLSVGGALLAGARCAAISVVLAACFALMIGVLAFDDGAAKWFGVASALGVPLAFGAALGSVLFQRAGRDGGDDEEGGDTIDDSTVVRDISAGILGALFLSLPIAPTEEVPLIASMLDPTRVAIVVPSTLLVCYIILFATGFLEHRGRRHASVLATFAVTATTTAIAFVVVACLLFAFGQLDTTTPPEWLVRQIVALAPPAVIGAAAGRLAAA